MEQPEFVGIEKVPKLTETEELKVRLLQTERALCRSTITASQMRLTELDRMEQELDRQIRARIDAPANVVELGDKAA